jgi:hypothetical protein
MSENSKNNYNSILIKEPRCHRHDSLLKNINMHHKKLKLTAGLRIVETDLPCKGQLQRLKS